VAARVAGERDVHVRMRGQRRGGGVGLSCEPVAVAEEWVHEGSRRAERRWSTAV